MLPRSIVLRLSMCCCLLGAGQASGAGPELKHWFPAGGQRGSTVELTVAGNFPKWPIGAWVDRPGLKITPGEKGKLTVEVQPEAAPGVYWLRLYDDSAAAAPRPFVVGTIAEVIETEPNNSPPQTQQLALPTVVNGRLGTRGDVDIARVELHQGQTLIASLMAHETLASPLDAVMQIVSPTGHVLADNHDHTGLDPQIAFTAPGDGEYLVRIFGFPSAPNSTIGFAGSDDYIYRLTLTTGPFADYAWPLAIARDVSSGVRLFGWNLPAEGLPVETSGNDDLLTLSDAQLANTVRVAREPHPTTIEQEPNGADAPQPLDIPQTVSGRLDPPGDVDVFVFQGAAGQALSFKLASRSLGYPTDGVLQVTDSDGKSLARVDDVGQTRDPVLTFSPPADGEYRLIVRDLHHQGSSRHLYRLRATHPEPDFSVSADADSYVLAAGKPTEITLTIDRRQDFAEDVDFHVTGLPEYVQLAAPTSTGSGNKAKTVKLVLTSEQGPFSGPIQIVGTSSGALQRSHTVTAAIPGHEHRVADLWLTVVGEPK